MKTLSKETKMLSFLLVGTLAGVLAAGPSVAQAQMTGTTTPKESPSGSAPAEKPSRLSMPHRVTGEIVSSDPSGSTLTVKDSKGKEYTFKADADAATRLSDLKTGDRVKVDYRKSQGQMVATKIVEAPVRALK